MSTSLRPNVSPSPSHTSSHHVLNRADSRRDHQYTKLYSELDAHGYHSSNSTAGEIELIPLLKALNRTGPEHSVLSLGCGVCAALPVYRSELRVDMYGTDVSTVAYQHAADLGRVNSTCSAKPCLRVGMAFAIPWPSASFDTAVSSDVMEHVAEADIPRSVSEASRVVRCLLLLAIARGSSVRNGIELHATQRNTSWWRYIYTRNGDWEELDVPRVEFEVDVPHELQVTLSTGQMEVLKLMGGALGRAARAVMAVGLPCERQARGRCRLAPPSTRGAAPTSRWT